MLTVKAINNDSLLLASETAAKIDIYPFSQEFLLMIHNADFTHSSNTNPVLAKDKLDKKHLPKPSKTWQSCPQFNSFESKRQRNLESRAKINPWLNLPLAETVSALTQIIDFETNILEHNYQSKFLSANPEGRKLKILVIEDCDDSRDYICTMLRTENFQVIAAKDSETAIRLAHAEIPDLIICELMMPIIDGHGIIDSLCHSTITGNMLLLFITAHHWETNIASEISLVSDLEAIEPLTKEKLLRAINHRVNMMAVSG